MLAAFKTFTTRFRTFISAGAFALVGLVSVAGGIDLTPVVALFVKDPALLGAAMVGVGILFGYLHYLANAARERDKDRERAVLAVVAPSVPTTVLDAPVIPAAPPVDDGKPFVAREKTDTGE